LRVSDVTNTAFVDVVLFSAEPSRPSYVIEVLAVTRRISRIRLTQALNSVGIASTILEKSNNEPVLPLILLVLGREAEEPSGLFPATSGGPGIIQIGSDLLDLFLEDPERLRRLIES
ncbi:MAG: hypothetical protein ABIQ01_05265, partial [Pseudolysinimonas sp.]